MQFQSSFITQAGSNLFASATSSTNGDPSTPIVWMYARTYNLDTSEYSPDAMRALDVSALTNGSGNKQTSIGNVTSAVPFTATDSSSGVSVQIPAVRLTCELSNTNTYYGLARNLAVFAKLKGQPDTSAVLAAIARVDAGYHVDDIPKKSDGDFSATIDFILVVKDSQINTIQAPTSYYASAQTVQSLADRVVTTHVANSTTTGEDQDIYGVKTFKNTTKHTSNILPTVNNTYSLGDTTLGWKNIYAENYYVGNTSLSSYIAGTTVTNATTATNLASAPSLSFSAATSSTAGSTLTVTAGGNTSQPITIDKVRSAVKATLDGNGNTITSYYCTVSTNQTISGNKTFSGNNTFSGTNTFSGIYSCKVKYIMSDAGYGTDTNIILYSNLLPVNESGITPSLGSSSKKFYNIYAHNLHGVIPTINSRSDIPLGSIVLLKIGFEVKVGEDVCNRTSNGKWFIRTDSSRQADTLYLGSIEPDSSYNETVSKNGYYFRVISHAKANYPFLAIRTN